MTTLTEKIIKSLPQEVYEWNIEVTEAKESGDEGYLSVMCENQERARGFNSCRSEVIDTIPKILEIVRGEVENLDNPFRKFTEDEALNQNLAEWALVELGGRKGFERYREDFLSILK